MAMMLRRHYEYLTQEKPSAALTATLAEKLATGELVADTPAAKTASGAKAE